MFRAKTLFTDLQDNGYRYNPGDIYPRVGYEPNESRINELLTCNNRRKKPMIEVVEDEPVTEEPIEEPIDKPVEQPKPKKKRSKAKVSEAEVPEEE